ncbi:MAG: Rieske 2Fe-2S domain-containing protein [Flavobacteriaceae bacterium]|nr:Rieske 2Fe-2S domain-containing protein [Flavobacteriaceae bacterium]
MNRKEFLKTLGAGAVFTLMVPCVSCSKTDEVIPEDPIDPGNGKIDITLDLEDTEHQSLKNLGGFVVKENKVVVARTLEGDYVAATRECAHRGNYQIVFQNNNFSCSVHGAKFDTKGAPTNSVTSNSLKIYKTELNGTTLRVFE